MKLRTIAALVGLLVLFVSCYAQKQNDAMEPSVHKTDDELQTALTKGDSATLDRIIADDYLEIDAQGVVKEKPQILALARTISSLPPSKSVGPEKSVAKMRIRVRGDSAQVTGFVTTRYQFMEYSSSTNAAQPANPSSVDEEFFMRTYVRINRQWKLVSSQTTAIPKEAPSPNASSKQ